MLKEHSFPAPVLKGEGRIYNIFWRTGIFYTGIIFKAIFGCVYDNGFLAGEPRLGGRKVDFRFLSGYGSGD